MAETPNKRHPLVYTIPPHDRFLQTLARAVLSGEILPQTHDLSGPFGLADISIYLPTQRSCRLLEGAFRAEAGAASLLLPRIRALGDVEEEGRIFEPDDLGVLPGSVAPQAIDPLERQLVLTRLVTRWGEAMAGRNTVLHRGDQPLLVPASPADAAWLAADLGALLDRAATEGVSWDGLGDLVTGDLAAFWELSLDFLKIVTELWPAYLAERGLVDGATRRDALIAEEQARLATLNGPVIAAGSTGTLPSTGRFLKAVAFHPQGAVILPGFDQHMDAETYEALGGNHNRAEAISGHPQYGMKQLLMHAIGMLPADVQSLGNADPTAMVRTRLVAAAMLPAPVTDQWHSVQAALEPAAVKAAFTDVSLIDAKTDADEALAIACALRGFTETETETETKSESGKACLVTPDRALARRVALELRRWGLEVDDSAGRPLAKTAPAVKAQLIADVVASDFDPVTLLALLKHPLATFGMEPGDVRRAARVLDLAVLRGPRLAGGSRGLARRLRGMADDVLRGTAEVKADGRDKAIQRLHPAIRDYQEQDWLLAETLCERLTEAFEPMEKLHAGSEEIALNHLAAAHKAVMQAVTNSRDATPANTPAHTPAGRAIDRLIESLTGQEAEALTVRTGDYPTLFRAFMGSATVRGRAAEDPRILILGALEARLLDPDLIVLAGLDEGVWPKQTETDAFMSRTMRADMDMEAPERMMGLAAHDVCQGLGAPRVILSRSAKRAGTPTVMSRWLQRLLALVGDDVGAQLRARGDEMLSWAAALDQHAYRTWKTERPNPTPPVEARPTSLSVTRVELWVRDPYQIYADRILGLKSIEPLGQVPDFAERGTLIHTVLDRFNRQWDGKVNDAAREKLLTIGKELFEERLREFPEERALWWPRFERIAKAYLNWEAARPFPLTERLSEVSGRFDMVVDGKPFRLTGTLDRLDVRADGSLEIIDFKTGNPPTPAQVKSGLSAQLALEVTMQKGGAFEAQKVLQSAPVAELGWVKLDGKSDEASLSVAYKKDRKTGLPEDTPDDLGALAEKQLIALIRQYRDPTQGYMSQPRPDFESRFESPYDHLARVKEWRLADDE